MHFDNTITLRVVHSKCNTSAKFNASTKTLDEIRRNLEVLPRSFELAEDNQAFSEQFRTTPNPSEELECHPNIFEYL